MSAHRTERVAEQIRAVLAEAIREIRDPRVGYATVTGVTLSPDLKQARVFVSRLGGEADREAAVDALNHAATFLRHAVALRAKLKFTPMLRFLPDAAIERGYRVEEIIREIHAHDDEGGPEGSE